MAEAVSIQLAVPTQPAAPMPQALPNSVDQSADLTRTELTKEKNLYVTDAMGNSRQVRLTERWELRTVHDRLFARSSARQIVERNITSQAPQTLCAFKALSSLSIPVSQPAVIRNMAYPGNYISAAWRALPDRSIASFFPMPHVVHVSVTRPDPIESPSAQMVIEVIAKVAQLIALLTGDTVQLIDDRQGESEDHSTSRGVRVPRSQRHSISELLGNLINSLMLQGRPEDIQKAMDLSRLHGKLSLALKDAASLSDPALLQEFDALFNQYAAGIAAEMKGFAINRQCLSELLKSGAVNVLNTGVEHDGFSLPVKSGGNNAHDKHELENGERPVPAGKNSAHEVGRAESGNKASINASINNSATPSTSNQVMSSLNQLLASMGLANITAQPLPAMESGPKQLPPIILPTTNPGNRSDKRRKTRKERKEEEEKEREGKSFLFDDDPFEPFDDE